MHLVICDLTVKFIYWFYYKLLIILILKHFLIIYKMENFNFEKNFNNYTVCLNLNSIINFKKLHYLYVVRIKFFNPL